jgi:hypothetical protein
MGASTGPGMLREETLFVLSLPLAATQKVYRNRMACVDTSTNTIKAGAASVSTLVRIGTFLDSVDNSAGTGSLQCQVRLEKEIRAQWWDNATGSAKIALTDFWKNAYVNDDHTVGITSGSNGVAGRIWDVDAVKGVLVQAIHDTQTL